MHLSCTRSACLGIPVPSVVVVSEAILYPGLVFFLSIMSLSTFFCGPSGCPEIREKPQTSRFQKYTLTRKMLVFVPIRSQWKWLQWDQNTSRAYDFDFVTGNGPRLRSFWFVQLQKITIIVKRSSQSFLGKVFAGPSNFTFRRA